MKKKRLSLFLVLCLCLSLTMPAFAATNEAKTAADRLNGLGLFSGVGTNADGSPNYDLDRALVRSEGVTLLVRLLGKDAQVKTMKADMPFTDVPHWAKGYVSYAYQNGLTRGVSETSFGSEETVSAAQYLTFILRALGYDSTKDFNWEKAWEKTDALGVTQGQYNENTTVFTRGDAVIIASAALDVKAKGGDKTLLELVKESLASAPVETALSKVQAATEKTSAASSLQAKTVMDVALNISAIGLADKIEMKVMMDLSYIANPEKYKLLVEVQENGAVTSKEECYLIAQGSNYMAYINNGSGWKSSVEENASSGGFNAATMLDMYPSISPDMVEVGEVTIDGKKATKYTGQIPKEHIVEVFQTAGLGDTMGDISQISRTGLTEEQLFSSLGDIPFSFYVGADGYVLRFEMDMTGMLDSIYKEISKMFKDDLGIAMEVSATKMTITTDYSNFNAVSDFFVPTQAK